MLVLLDFFSMRSTISLNFSEKTCVMWVCVCVFKMSCTHVRETREMKLFNSMEKSNKEFNVFVAICNRTETRVSCMEKFEDNQKVFRLL